MKGGNAARGKGCTPQKVEGKILPPRLITLPEGVQQASEDVRAPLRYYMRVCYARRV